MEERRVKNRKEEKEKERSGRREEKKKDKKGEERGEKRGEGCRKEVEKKRRQWTQREGRERVMLIGCSRMGAGLRETR